MSVEERIPSSIKKKKKEPLKIIEHSDLSPEERQAAYKFFKDHPEDALGSEDRKRKRKQSKIKRCRCK